MLLALVFRVLLLFSLFWLIGLTASVFTVFGQDFSWRDLVLIAGGAFLLYKATTEIHRDVEGGRAAEAGSTVKVYASFGMIVTQIAVIDMVFSVDSILTAIGMADHVGVMIAAVVIAIGIMYLASGPVAAFIERHPTTRMLALAFLLMIGIALIADGIGFHIPRGYLYAAMAFSAIVELLNVVAGGTGESGMHEPAIQGRRLRGQWRTCTGVGRPVSLTPARLSWRCSSSRRCCWPIGCPASRMSRRARPQPQRARRRAGRPAARHVSRDRVAGPLIERFTARRTILFALSGLWPSRWCFPASPGTCRRFLRRCS